MPNNAAEEIFEIQSSDPRTNEGRTATTVSYDNIVSGLEATNVQSAIDEVIEKRIPDIEITTTSFEEPTTTLATITLTIYDEQSGQPVEVTKTIKTPNASGGIQALNDLSDVMNVNPSDRQVLIYDSEAEEYVNEDMYAQNVKYTTPDVEHFNVNNTQDAIDTLYSAKANSADLATVATTGDFSDLNNIPVTTANSVTYTNTQSGLVATSVQDAIDEIAAGGGGGGGGISSSVIASNYDNTSTYDVGDYCMESDLLYICTTAVTIPEAFDNTKWLNICVGDELQKKLEIEDISTIVCDEFSTSSTYAVGDFVIYQGSLYKCTTAVIVAGAWTGSTNWTQTQVVNEFGSGGGGATTLDGLTDVTITSATNNQVLTYNNGTWVNSAAPGGATTLNALTDVDITSAANGQILTYNTNEWANTNLTSTLVSYSNTTSGLIATTTQGAIDELAGTIGDINSLLAAI